MKNLILIVLLLPLTLFAQNQGIEYKVNVETMQDNKNIEKIIDSKMSELIELHGQRDATLMKLRTKAKKNERDLHQMRAFNTKTVSGGIRDSHIELAEKAMKDIEAEVKNQVGTGVLVPKEQRNINQRRNQLEKALKLELQSLKNNKNLDQNFQEKISNYQKIVKSFHQTDDYLPTGKNKRKKTKINNLFEMNTQEVEDKYKIVSDLAPRLLTNNDEGKNVFKVISQEAKDQRDALKAFSKEAAKKLEGLNDDSPEYRSYIESSRKLLEQELTLSSMKKNLNNSIASKVTQEMIDIEEERVKKLKEEKVKAYALFFNKIKDKDHIKKQLEQAEILNYLAIDHRHRTYIDRDFKSKELLKYKNFNDFNKNKNGRKLNYFTRKKVNTKTLKGIEPTEIAEITNNKAPATLTKTQSTMISTPISPTQEVQTISISSAHQSTKLKKNDNNNHKEKSNNYKKENNSKEKSVPTKTQAPNISSTKKPKEKSYKANTKKEKIASKKTNEQPISDELKAKENTSINSAVEAKRNIATPTEKLESDSVKCPNAQWVPELPRRKVWGPNCGRKANTNICIGYVRCKSKNYDFLRLATCPADYCGEKQAADCSKVGGAGSVDPKGKTGDSKNRSYIQDLINSFSGSNQ